MTGRYPTTAFRFLDSFVRQAILSLILIAVSGISLYAQQPRNFLSVRPEPQASVFESLTSSSARSVISLNGSWEYSDDDGDTWSPVAIPSCYMSSERIRLRRSFRVPKGMLIKYRWELIGYGIQYSGSITINGAFIVQREGLIPFRASLPEEVELKENNVIEVEVDNRLGYSGTVPGRRLPLDVRTYGGIIRDIFLVGVPIVHIDDVKILRQKNAQVVFDVNVVSGSMSDLRYSGGESLGGGSGRIGANQAEFDVVVAIKSVPQNDSAIASEAGRSEGKIVLQSKRSESIRLTPAIPGPSFWQPGSPKLYTAVIQVRYKGALIDEKVVRFGYRNIKAQGSWILLNDSAVRLNGVVYIEDSEKYGASLSYKQMREDVEVIRDLGINIVRFIGSVPHPYLLELCDRYGIMAMIDIPCGAPPPFLFDNAQYLNRALEQARYTVEATQKYTSVVGYGVGLPIGIDAGDGKSFLAAMREMLDSLTTGTLFYAVASNWTDPELRALVDFAGVAQLDGSVDEVKMLLKQAVAATDGRMPVMLMAFGKIVRIGNQNGYSDSISTQAQAKFIGDVYRLRDEISIAGLCYWSFADYRTDRPLLTVNNDDQYLISSGLTTLDRQMRISGTTLGALYTDQKVPDLAIGEYTPPSTVLFIVLGIGCVILFLFLINNSRRFRENVFRALLRPYNFFADIRDQRILSTIQTTILALIVALTFAVIFTSLSYFYRMNEAFDFVLSAVIVSDSIKQTIDYMIWRPALAVIGFTGTFFLLLLFTAVCIRTGSIFIRNRIFFNDAYAIAVWGALPVLLLIPIAMILYRLLELPSVGTIAFLLVLGVIAWMIYRVLRGTSVVYDVRSSKIYVYSIGSLLVLVMILIVTSDNIYAMLSYLRMGITSLYGF
ncbi:MAG: hypothetical protein J4G05_01085 [Chlorobi bacterium]|nr:hypothetical protein [Chlorobiota bacterium]